LLFLLQRFSKVITETSRAESGENFGGKLRGAHPSRVLVEASRLDELPAWMRLQPAESEDRKAVRWSEVRAGGTPNTVRITSNFEGG